MSAMQQAFSKAGVSPALAELRAALSKFVNQGGTTAIIRAEADAIDRMPGMGQPPSAPSQHPYAQPRQPLEDGGATHELPQGLGLNAPSSSSDRSGEGQISAAQQGHFARALPVRDPKPQRAPIDFGKAALAIKTKLALSVLDTLKIDGRAIGDWTVADARRLGPQKTREGHILMAATRKVANAQGYQLIRDVLKAEELQLIMQKAAEVSDEVPA